MLVSLKYSKDKLKDTIASLVEKKKTELDYAEEIDRLIHNLDMRLKVGFSGLNKEIDTGMYTGLDDYYDITKYSNAVNAVRLPRVCDNFTKLSYGYADSLEQILDYYSDIIESDSRMFVISINKVDNPTVYSVYKHGRYIGNLESPLKQDSIIKYLVYEIKELLD